MAPACAHAATCADPTRCAAVDLLAQVRALLVPLCWNPPAVGRPVGAALKLLDRALNALEA